MVKKAIQNKELKSFLNTKKRETKLVGALERHILAKPFDERNHDVLHPSDLVKIEWCALAAYHALRGNYVEVRDKLTLRQASIFAEGNYIHTKWQTWIAEMGNLYGTWKDKTGTSWALSKDIHPSVDYAEVPLHSAKHKISGKADGWVKGLGPDFLIEIKSIGPGTLRFEAPYLLAEADGDVEKAWKNIKSPFRSHQLQGQVYLHLCHLMVAEGLLDSAPTEIVFIYELKSSQDYKEFTVQYNPEYTKDIFDKAMDVSWAVDNNRPPVCSINPVVGCKRCAPFRGGEA